MRLTWLLAKCIPGQTLTQVSEASRASWVKTYRLPKPNAILSISRGGSFPSAGSHLSGMNLSGSSYTFGSLVIALPSEVHQGQGYIVEHKRVLEPLTKYYKVLRFRRGFGSHCIHHQQLENAEVLATMPSAVYARSKSIIYLAAQHTAT